jgi:hypothetical protein
MKGYKTILDGDEQRLNYWLLRLAEVGHRVYRNLTSEDESQATLSFNYGTVIQVNPVVGRATFPWALLYEADLMYLPGLTRICPEYRDHGPEACPYGADPMVVCPCAFWGYRYAIEQLPCWVSGEVPQLPTLVRQVSNGKPVNLNLNVWRNFSYWKDQQKHLNATGVVNLLVAEEVPQLQKIWQQQGGELDFIYFYVHGGVDDTIGPFLELSDYRIGSNILSALNVFWARHPLVLLNGCGTGDYGPDSYISLIDDFRRMGASGVVGTECVVPEIFAQAYAQKLVARLLQGERLGQAMLEIRCEFLLEHRNPLGLAYSLYAPSEVALAQPVLAAQ